MLFLIAESMDGRGGVREARKHVFPKTKALAFARAFPGEGLLGEAPVGPETQGLKPRFSLPS